MSFGRVEAAACAPSPFVLVAHPSLDTNSDKLFSNGRCKEPHALEA